MTERQLAEKVAQLQRVRDTHLSVIYKQGKEIENLTAYLEILKVRLLEISKLAGLPSRHTVDEYVNGRCVGTFYGEGE